MLLAALRRRDAPAADLARVLACWLAVILLVQGLAALQTLVLGPAHRHLALESASVSVSMWASAHANSHPTTPAPPQATTHAASHATATLHDLWHAMAHARGEAHHHAADEVVLPAGTEAGHDAAAFVLLAALAAMAVSYGWAASAARGGPAASVAWALAEHEPLPPRRPPRG